MTPTSSAKLRRPPRRKTCEARLSEFFKLKKQAAGNKDDEE